MNGLDLSLFQFDYDQTWAVIFFRPDGETVLARYGARADKDGMKYNSAHGFRDTMTHVLRVHRSWTDDLSPYYRAKRGPAARYPTADAIPSETIRRIVSRDDNGKQNCIHCHNVYDALHDADRDQGTYDPTNAFRYPLPDGIGLDHPAAEDRTTIPAEGQIARGSSEYFLRIDGQNLHSLADVQFALEHLDEDARQVTVETVALADPLIGKPIRRRTVKLESGWKQQGSIEWRVSMYGMPPKPGLWVQSMPDQDKALLSIPADRLAMKVRGVFGKDVKQAGLKTGDVIVQFGNQTAHHTEGQFHAALRLGYYQPNSRLPLKLIRNGKKMELTVHFPNQ